MSTSHLIWSHWVCELISLGATVLSLNWIGSVFIPLHCATAPTSNTLVCHRCMWGLRILVDSRQALIVLVVHLANEILGLSYARSLLPVMISNTICDDIPKCAHYLTLNTDRCQIRGLLGVWCPCGRDRTPNLFWRQIAFTQISPHIIMGSVFLAFRSSREIGQTLLDSMNTTPPNRIQCGDNVNESEVDDPNIIIAITAQTYARWCNVTLH